MSCGRTGRSCSKSSPGNSPRRESPTGAPDGRPRTRRPGEVERLPGDENSCGQPGQQQQSDKLLPPRRVGFLGNRPRQARRNAVLAQCPGEAPAGQDGHATRDHERCVHVTAEHKQLHALEQNSHRQPHRQNTPPAPAVAPAVGPEAGTGPRSSSPWSTPGSGPRRTKRTAPGGHDHPGTYGVG